MVALILQSNGADLSRSQANIYRDDDKVRMTPNDSGHATDYRWNCAL